MKDKSPEQSHPKTQPTDWTEDLRKKLADYEMAVPDDLWTDIAASLPKPEPKPTHLTLLRRWSIAAAVAALVALTSITMLFTDNGKQTTPTAKATVKDGETANNKTEASVEQEFLSSSEKKSAISKVLISSPEKTLVSRSDTLRKHEETAEPETPVIAQEQPTPKVQPKQEATLPEAIQNIHEELLTDNNESTEPWGENKERSTKVTLRLYASNLSSATDNFHSVRMSDNMARNYIPDPPQSNGVQYAPIYLSNYYERKKHYQPLSFGLTVGYSLNHRWQVTSGIIYNRLRSDFFNIMGGDVIERRQTLHYIGAPVNINYILWKNRWAGFYLSAGGEVLFNIKANSQTGVVQQHQQKDRPQFSTGAAIGAQLNVLPQLGIYVEPGGKYYINNGSDVENAFKEKPFQLSLQMGVRWSF